MKGISRRDFLGYLLTGGAALFAGRVAGNVYHAEVTHHHLTLPKLKQAVRVVQLSDLHYGPYLHEGSVATWVAQAQAERGDLIVLTGDTVDRWLKRPLEPLTKTLSNLSAPLGVWACLGNHDRRRFGHEIGKLEDALAEAGITLLVNRGTPLRGDLYLAAVDDYSTGEPDLEAALSKAPGSAATLLLCHQPDYFPQMTLPTDLTLAGHTHGGQVRLPLIGTPVTSSAYGERYLQGWAPPPDRRFGKGYVVRGLGVSFLPLRLNCPAELAVFDIAPDPALTERSGGTTRVARRKGALS